jgi:hypothetical protein
MYFSYLTTAYLKKLGTELEIEKPSSQWTRNESPEGGRQQNEIKRGNHSSKAMYKKFSDGKNKMRWGTEWKVLFQT